MMLTKMVDEMKQTKVLQGPQTNSLAKTRDSSIKESE